MDEVTELTERTWMRTHRMIKRHSVTFCSACTVSAEREIVRAACIQPGDQEPREQMREALTGWGAEGNEADKERKTLAWCYDCIWLWLDHLLSPSQLWFCDVLFSLCPHPSFLPSAYCSSVHFLCLSTRGQLSTSLSFIFKMSGHSPKAKS